MQLGTDEVDDSQGPPHTCTFDALTKVLVRRTDDNNNAITHVATARKDVSGRSSDAILPVELAMMGARGFPVEESPPGSLVSSPALSNALSLFYAVCSISRGRETAAGLGFRWRAKDRPLTIGTLVFRYYLCATRHFLRRTPRR